MEVALTAGTRAVWGRRCNLGPRPISPSSTGVASWPLQLRPDCLPGVSGPRSHEQGPPDMVSPVSLDFPGGQAGLLLLSPNSPHSCKLSCSCASQPGESLSQTSPPIPLLPHITCSEGPFQVCLALSALSPPPLFCPHLTSTAVNFLNGGTRNLQPPILQRL